MSRKSFSDETMKKVNWVTKMYSEWRSARNSLPQFETIVADLDNVFSLTVENLSFALCHFMTEIRKLNGCEFPSKTMYDIIICIQFYLGAFGFNWKLVDDVYFQDVKFTLDNLMKDRCTEFFRRRYSLEWWIPRVYKS